MRCSPIIFVTVIIGLAKDAARNTLKKARVCIAPIFYGRRSWETRIEPANAMALCFGCHQHVGSFPKDHVDLWESRFTKEETEHVNQLHIDFNIKKRDVATEERYKLLKLMLMKYTGGLK